MANRYWVGGTADWDATAGSKWALTSGGAGGEAVPTSSDDTFFDAASGAVTVTITATSNVKNLVFTGFTGTFTGASTLTISGNLTISTGMTLAKSGTIYIFATCALTSSGKSFGCDFNVQAPVTFQDAFITTTAIFLNSGGELNANNQNITMSNLNANNGDPRVINMGSGTWTLTGDSSGVWNMGTTTNLTFNANTSTIKFTGVLTANRIILSGGDATYNNVWVATTGSFASLIAGSNTYNNLKIDAGREVRFQDGKTQTVSTTTFTGTAGNEITLTGTSTGGWAISDTSGTNTADYCIISYSTAGGGATWNATNSIDGGNNTGWNFIAPTSSIKTFNGLAYASTKTVNELAIASVKTWDGLA